MIKLLIETNVEINLRSIEEFTRVMASELLEDKILFDIQREENLIKIKVSSEEYRICIYRFREQDRRSNFNYV